MTHRTIYTMLAAIGGNLVSCDFLDRRTAIEMAKAKFADGAKVARVYHYSEDGNNCYDDIWLELGL